jgi:hypothetical protein
MLIPYIHAHLYARGFDPSKYRVDIDEINGCATFLLWNRLGQLVGYQRYTPRYPKSGVKDPHKLAYFTWASKPHHTIWGWEYIPQNCNALYITEGIFDAIKICNAGFSAIALLGNAGSPAVRQYLSYLQFPRIAICDNDNAGKELAKAADFWYTVPSGYKDLGEMPQEEVNKWINAF